MYVCYPPLVKNVVVQTDTVSTLELSVYVKINKPTLGTNCCCVPTFGTLSP